MLLVGQLALGKVSSSYDPHRVFELRSFQLDSFLAGLYTMISSPSIHLTTTATGMPSRWSSIRWYAVSWSLSSASKVDHALFQDTLCSRTAAVLPVNLITLYTR